MSVACFSFIHLSFVYLNLIQLPVYIVIFNKHTSYYTIMCLSPTLFGKWKACVKSFAATTANTNTLIYNRLLKVKSRVPMQRLCLKNVAKFLLS